MLLICNIDNDPGCPFPDTKECLRKNMCLGKAPETSITDPPKDSFQEWLNSRLKEREKQNSKW